MARRHSILQVFVWTSLLLATPTARAQETVCSDDDEALPAECFPDILCPQYANYLDYRRAVVHIYGPDFQGTGVLINNFRCKHPEGGDPDCGAPYLLTAAHLLTDSVMGDEITPGDIYAIENEATFTLGFEAVSCGGYASNYEIAVGGAQVLLEDEQKDLMLLHLSTSLPPEAGPYFVGWGDDGSDEVAAITHACGGPKKIAITDRGMVDGPKDIVGRSVYEVHSWDVGGVINGSSGGPLLTENGKLIGVYSKTLVKGDVCPGDVQQSIFTAVETIVPFLWTVSINVSNNFSHWGAYDSNAYLPIHDVELNSEKYGPGEVVQISARQQVVLSNGFHAEAGSNVRVIIVPAGP